MQDPGNTGASDVANTPASSRRVAYLDQALWRQFHTAETPEQFTSSWLNLISSLIPGVSLGVVLLGAPEEGPFVPVASYPQGLKEAEKLGSICEVTIDERRGVVNRLDKSAEHDPDRQQNFHVANPLLIDDRLCGVVALEVSSTSETELKSIMRQLQWGMGWLELLYHRDSYKSVKQTRDRLINVLELVAAGLEHDGIHETLSSVLSELSARLECERVSLGMLQGNHMRIHSMSHSAQVGKQSNLVRNIELAMDEAHDQFSSISYTPDVPTAGKVTKAHTELHVAGNADYILTVLLVHGNEIRGAITLERLKRAFDPDEIALCEHAALLLAPIISIKQRDDQWIGKKVWQSFRLQVEKLIGPQYFGFKMAGVIAVTVLLILTLVKVDYRVTADAVLEGQVQRMIVAPIAGYVAEAHARAGDLVNKDSLLIELDDRDLRLEHAKILSEKAKIEKKYRDALSRHERSMVSILRKQLDQVEAEIELQEEQLARTRIRAPFAGVVVSGDLSQSLGGTVERGQVLLEVAPLDAYRVVLNIDERDITDIQQGQRGNLVLTAAPDTELSFMVSNVTPVATSAEGINSFRVEATLDEVPDILRPGMKGTGKVAVDQRRLIWVWTHRMTEWLKLLAWYWLP
jgi:RND family efflux transporter MFP subunit